MRYNIKAGGNLANNGSRFTGLLFTMWIMPQRNVTSANRPLRLARLQKTLWKIRLILKSGLWLAKGHRKLSHWIRFACFLFVIVDWYTRNSTVYTRLATKRPDWPVSPTPLVFNAPAEGFPCADLREILRGPLQMPSVQNRVKILPKSLTTWVGCTDVTDRQTTHTIAVPLAEHNVVTFG